MALPPRYRDLGFRLQIVARHWRRSANVALARIGLSEATGWALSNIVRLDDGVRQADLADAMGLESPSVGRLVEALCGAGLLERREDLTDGRARTLHLTARGTDVCADMERVLSQARNRLLRDISLADLDAFDRVCTTILNRPVVEAGELTP
jgi:MarR family transcriptional regulator for hemolysin